MKKTIKELAVELTIEITATCDNIKGRSVFVNQLLRSCSSIVGCKIVPHVEGTYFPQNVGYIVLKPLQ